MTSIEHSSIGENANRVVIEQEEKEKRTKELIEKFTMTPWHGVPIEVVSVWAAWVTLAATVFLYCTVKAVVLAVQ